MRGTWGTPLPGAPMFVVDFASSWLRFVPSHPCRKMRAMDGAPIFVVNSELGRLGVVLSQAKHHPILTVTVVWCEEAIENSHNNLIQFEE